MLKRRQPLNWKGPGINAIYGPVAQRLEQGTHNPLVGGSNPSGPTIPFPLQIESSHLGYV